MSVSVEGAEAEAVTLSASCLPACLPACTKAPHVRQLLQVNLLPAELHDHPAKMPPSTARRLVGPALTVRSVCDLDWRVSNFSVLAPLRQRTFLGCRLRTTDLLTLK